MANLNFKYLYMHNYLWIALLFSVLQLNCIVVLSRINPDTKAIIRYDFEKTVSVDFERIPEKVPERDRFMLDYYNTREIETAFLKSGYFIIDRNANLLVRYTSHSRESGPAVSSTLLWFVTLFAYPVRDYTDSTIAYEVYNKKTDELIKTYRYPFSVGGVKRMARINIESFAILCCFHANKNECL